MGLAFGECHFNGIEVRAVRRQEQEPSPGVPHDLGRRGVLVSGEIVENDDGTGGQFRNQYFLDVSREGGTVHRALDHPVARSWNRG